MKIVSARISTIAHATEDRSKVMKAVRTVCPEDLPSSAPQTGKFKGHYGNGIETITLSLRGRGSEIFFRRLWRNLTSSDQATIIREVDDRLDEEGNLHFRLDKDECYHAVLRLRNEDPIKIQVTLRAKLAREMPLSEAVREMLKTALV